MPLRVRTRRCRVPTNIMCVKYLALTFGERVGFVSRLPLRALGIPSLGIRHLRRSESDTAFLDLHPLSPS